MASYRAVFDFRNAHYAGAPIIQDLHLIYLVVVVVAVFMPCQLAYDLFGCSNTGLDPYMRMARESALLESLFAISRTVNIVFLS